MKSALIIVERPGFKDVLGLGEQDELGYLQTSVSSQLSGYVFLQLPAVALPGLQVATYRLTEVFARPVNNSLVAHATAQIWLCLSC